MRIEEQYEADCKKWREFKSWLLTGGSVSELQPNRNSPSPESAAKTAMSRDANTKEAVFRYVEVVRNKRERGHMEGGDCECCRDVRSLHQFP